MSKVAFQQSIYTNTIPLQGKAGVLTHIKLNYHEIVCIELALIDLAKSIRNKDLPKALTRFSSKHLSAQLGYLKCWLNRPALKSQLRLDGKNNVLWPFTSSELVDWLLLICQSCKRENANYNDMVTTCHNALVRKLVAIQEQRYPLFPKFYLAS